MVNPRKPKPAAAEPVLAYQYNRFMQSGEAGGVSIGLNIKLPSEQKPNPYVTPELNFLFKYFFMRKLWFAAPARALIVFPGGYGTMDELWEFLTLVQTRKMGHNVIILLYGSEVWKK